MKVGDEVKLADPDRPKKVRNSCGWVWNVGVDIKPSEKGVIVQVYHDSEAEAAAVRGDYSRRDRVG